MRAPHRGRASVVAGLVTMLFTLTLVFVVFGTVYGVHRGAHATTPPADTPTPAILVPPIPHVFEYIDEQTGCRYLGSSAGGMTARYRVPAGSVGPVAPIPWCGK